MTLPTSAVIKVIASLLTNIAAGLILGLVAIKDAWVLTGNIGAATICLVIAIKLESLLKNL